MTVELFMPPHADVRIVCEDIWKLRSGLLAMGLHAPALDKAIDMLTRQSIEVERLRVYVAELEADAERYP